MIDLFALTTGQRIATRLSVYEVLRNSGTEVILKNAHHPEASLLFVRPGTHSADALARVGKVV